MIAMIAMIAMTKSSELRVRAAAHPSAKCCRAEWLDTVCISSHDGEATMPRLFVPMSADGIRP